MEISANQLLNSLSKEQFLSMIDGNNSCKGMLMGYIAEQVLANKLSEIPEVLKVSKIPDQDKRKGDLLILYKLKENDEIIEFSIEVKCVRSKTAKLQLLDGGFTGRVQVGFSDSTVLNDGTRTSCALRGSFDILAICTVTVTGEWDFYFIHNKYLPTSEKHPDRIESNLIINTDNTPCLYKDIKKVIQDLS